MGPGYSGACRLGKELDIQLLKKGMKLEGFKERAD